MTRAKIVFTPSAVKQAVAPLHLVVSKVMGLTAVPKPFAYRVQRNQENRPSGPATQSDTPNDDRPGNPRRGRDGLRARTRLGAASENAMPSITPNTPFRVTCFLSMGWATGALHALSCTSWVVFGAWFFVWPFLILFLEIAILDSEIRYHKHVRDE